MKKRLLLFFIVSIFLISGCQETFQDEKYTHEIVEEELKIDPPPVETEKQEEIKSEINTQREPGKEGCEGTDIKFDYSPVNLEKTLVFLPLGLMTGSHVTPTDHHYFQNFDNDKPDIEVYSPGDGYITSIGHMPGAKEGEDFRVVIQHTCTVSSIYIHIHTLSTKLKEYDPGKQGYTSEIIPVGAGELIGYYATNVDYNLVDEDVILTGFLVPEHYEGEPWKIHVPNTYEYFNEPIKSQLIEKSLRTIEPISGKIDYDIDGKLIGNWFLEGTNGYKGIDLNSYWSGHLAIAYDAYDPSTIVFSIGGYSQGDSKQFGVKDNAPDPAEVGVESGLIKYQLVEYDYLTSDGNYWNKRSLAKGLKTTTNEIVKGVVLVQMLEDRKIQFEVFPDKKASEINYFTNGARIYER